MSKGQKQTLFPLEKKCQKVHKKVLSTTNHWGNENENHSDIISHLLRHPLLKRQERINGGKM
jgi:hypothetical protein